jgi:DHA1 family tetracycline resistance protein-like MFS transporter
MGVQREKLVVMFTVFVDVIGIGIVIPILPFYVGSFGASPFVITLLFATYAFCSFLSSPLFGALSDKVGRRPLLIVSISSTALGWFVFAGASSIPLLFLGRIIDGSAAGNFTVAQSSLVDLARNDKERSANLGLIGATFGIGLMLGPFLGGVLSTVSHAFPFWFVGILATTNAILAYFFLPETHKRRDSQAKLSFNPLTPLARAALNVNLRGLFISWILFALSIAASQSIFALYGQHAFGFDALTTGLVFALTGIFAVLNQAVLLKRLWLPHFTEKRLEALMIAMLGMSFLLMGLRVMSLFILALPFFATSQSVLRVVVTSQVAGRADPLMKGEAIGILSSLMSACMIIGPILSGALFELHDSLPYLGAAAVMALSFTIALRFRRPPAHRSSEAQA